MIVKTGTCRKVPLSLIAKCLMTFNKRKFGKHRRGTVVLEQYDFQRQRDMSFKWRLVFQERRTNYVQFIDATNQHELRRFTVYRYEDLGLLLSKLYRC